MNPNQNAPPSEAKQPSETDGGSLQDLTPHERSETRSMLWVVLNMFLGAAGASMLYRATRDRAGWLLALLPLSVIAWASQHWSAVAAGEQHRWVVSWAPSLGVNAAFNLDGLALVFLLLICGIGALVLIYASRYLREDDRLGRFYAYLLLFMGSMVGLVLADNVLALFIFWELTSISSFLLIGWDHERAGARKAALTSLLVTGGGGMMLMAGLVLLMVISGETEFSRISGDIVRESPLYLLTLVLILGGAFTKSAQVPWHFWLPGAMAAPTPVSAYLHSATMVKAGIYLMARLHPTMGSTDAWFNIVTPIGAATMVFGAVIAITQVDLKRILAYSTVSVLGTLTMLLGIGTKAAIWAAMAYLVAHSLYKGALFLIAGVLDHEAGTRDITRMRGLARLMPLTAAAAILAAAASAGMLPLFGFISKELFYEAAWSAPGVGGFALTAAFIASVMMVIVAFMSAYRPFFAGPAEAPNLPHEAPLRLWLGPMVLALIGLILGLAPGLINNLLTSAVSSVSGESTPMTLALWHGFTPILGLSAITLLLGAVLFFVLRPWQSRLLERADLLQRVGPQRIYDGVFAGAMRFAEWQTKVVQSGYLRNYVLIVVVTLLALLARPTLEGHVLSLNDLRGVQPPEMVLTVMILLAALAAVTRMRSRLAVAATLGVIGIAVMLLYVIFGALDLAVTQIMVETLTVVLLVLVLYHLPRFVSYSPRWILVRDAIVSLLFGGVIALLVVKAFSVQPDPAMREFFVANSYVEAHGRNVVNVILVDFRAMDTMGEVTVLTVAGIGVYALLKIRPNRGRKEQ